MKRLIDRRVALGALITAGSGMVVGRTAFGEETQTVPSPWPQEGDITFLPRPSESTDIEAIKVPEVSRGQTILYFTGDVSMTDVNRETLSFPGGLDGQGRSRGSIVIVRGPIGLGVGGKDVSLNIRPKYVSIWKVSSPVGDPDLNNNINKLINTGLNSFRRNNVTSHISVAIIDGATGAIVATPDIFPGQKLPALEGRTYLNFVANDKK